MHKTIAIVGAGPRGLSALEHLCSSLALRNGVSFPVIHLYEKEPVAGAGQVWKTDQQTVNWLNISQRALKELKGREEASYSGYSIPGFPSYHDWLPASEKADNDHDPDLFPPRAQMGKYLKERMSSIINPLKKSGYLKLKNVTVQNVLFQENRFTLSGDGFMDGPFDEVLLTLGHQPTEMDKQMMNWVNHQDDSASFKLFTNPYPVSQFIETSGINHQSHVAIRGFGLATIDVLRALTIGLGGKFVITDKRTFASDFYTSESVPSRIVPFSLNGKPLVAKPLNGFLDNVYTPTRQEIVTFKRFLDGYTSGKKQPKDIGFLRTAIAQVAANRYQELHKKSVYQFEQKSVLSQVIEQWLENEDFKHPALYLKKDTARTIHDYNQMAVGDSVITLDYCVGQVWRHCQPVMYKSFSHSALEAQLMKDVVALDERMKRYAYGPPVESMQQLLALHRAGLLSFEWIDDPKIQLTEEGWQLKNSKEVINCDTMINSILNPPKLLEVTSPLITNLLNQDFLKPVHSELGIETEPNGLVVLENTEKKIPLAMLGRLCQGSVLGVDAILECFRLRVKDWANGAVQRLSS